MKYQDLHRQLLGDGEEGKTPENTPAGYVIFDQELKIRSSDHRFAQYFFLTPQQLVGVSVKALVRDVSQSAFDFGIRILHKNGAFKIDELKLMTGPNMSSFEFCGERLIFNDHAFTLGYIMETSK